MQQNQNTINGFSKLPKEGKVDWVASRFFDSPAPAAADFRRFWLEDPELQRIIDGFSENTLSNFVLPYGVAPNFLIDNQVYCVPMVVEESSVVAAASSAAKFWMDRGGFHTRVVDTRKVGQVHFLWKGSSDILRRNLPELLEQFYADSDSITANMRARGGGIVGIELLDLTHLEADYYQIKVHFETCDSMGANFINSVLESFAQTLTDFVDTHPAFGTCPHQVEVLMSILSNYTPECLVEAWVECAIPQLGQVCDDMDGLEFAERFQKAVRIARIDPHRATTHNKGIFNGIDAVVIATGNDFRAVEACGHTYAARDGQYRSLSSCTIENGIFRFSLEIPLALGTVGGLTRLHPLAQRSLEMLGNPSASDLMRIVAAVGLAQNFAAVRSLVTTGIQQGHMKLHLQNILNHLNASEWESGLARSYFADKTVAFSAVRQFLERLRTSQPTP